MMILLEHHVPIVDGLARTLMSMSPEERAREFVKRLPLDKYGTGRENNASQLEEVFTELIKKRRAGESITVLSDESPADPICKACGAYGDSEKCNRILMSGTAEIVIDKLPGLTPSFWGRFDEYLTTQQEPRRRNR